MKVFQAFSSINKYQFGLFWFILVAAKLMIYNICLSSLFIDQRWDILDISKLP